MPFTWAFDGSQLEGFGTDALGSSVYLLGGYGDFFLRRVVGQNRMLSTAGNGAFQISRKYRNVYLSSDPIQPTNSPELAIAPEEMYPETGKIFFDLYGVELPDAPLTAQIAFQGVRRQHGIPDKPDYPHFPKSFKYVVEATLTQANATCATSAYSQQQLLYDSAAASKQGASLACVGNILVVGSEGASSDTPPYGSIQIYNLVGSDWVLQQTIYPADGAGQMNFGVSVAFDGTTIAVGANELGHSGNGKVYLYRLSGSTWTLYQEIASPQVGGQDAFGNSVQVSGNTLVIGAPFGISASVETGLVYYYKNTGSSYGFVQSFTGSDSMSLDGFGTQLSIYGTWLMVRTQINSVRAGTYVFSLGSTYAQTQKLTSGNPSCSYVFVASNATAYIGVGNPAGVGTVYVVTNAGGTWTLGTALQSGVSSDQFGASITGTDTDVFIGAPATNGGVYWFEKQSGTWHNLQQITVNVPEAFAASVAITGDWLIAGDPSSTQGAGIAGAVYTFLYGCTSYVPSATRIAGPIITVTPITDYDFELYQIILVASINGGSWEPITSPLCSLTVYDQNKVAISNIPILDIFYNGAPGSPYENGAVVPPLYFRRNTSIEIDFWSEVIDPTLLPVVVQCILVGRQLIPC